MRGSCLIGIAVAISPIAAEAQQTNCMPVGNGWSCSTTQPIAPAPPVNWGALQQQQSPYDAFMQGRQDAERLKQQQLQNQLLQQQLAQPQSSDGGYAEAMADVRRAVAAKARAGDCKGAVDLALLAGNVRMAADAKAVCPTP